MHKNELHKVIKILPGGFSYLKLLFNEEGSATDYTFMDVNSKFASFLDIDAEKLIKKNYSEISDILRCEFMHNFPMLSDVAVNQTEQSFEFYCNERDQYFQIDIRSPESKCITIFINNISAIKEEQSKLLESQSRLKLAMDAS